MLAALHAGAQTQCVETNVVKFVQPPNLDGGLNVWDSGPWVLADDFICTNTGPISDIHLWGSWLNDLTDLNTTFWLGIFDDVKAITNGPVIIPSHPGTNLIWQQWFGPGQYVQNFCCPGNDQFYDPGASAPMGPDTKVDYYCFYPANPPTQYGTFTQPKIYWLSVYAMPSQGNASLFGWHSSSLHQFDISVFAPWPGGPPTTANWQPIRTPNNAPVDLAFKVNTATNGPPPQPCCPETNGVKFVQRPRVPGGLDVNASQALILADDFKCTNNGPITDIHVWGSWLNNGVDPNAVFSLGIWSDVPATTNATGGTVPSHPGIQLWASRFGPGEYSLCPYTNITEQFYDPSVPFLGGDTQVYYLCFYPTNPFVQQGTAALPTNYWLSVNAQTTAGSGLLFGWHTSIDYYNDTAVWGNAPFPAAWNTLIDPQGIPLSMAFKVNTFTNECPPPILLCSNKTVECGTQWSVAPPTVIDPCCPTAPVPTVVSVVTNGTCPQLITITWQVTDCRGLSVNCSQTITVVDTTPPVITCSPDRTVECTLPWNFDTPTATDRCCTNVTITVLNTFTNGNCSPTITRIWMAKDCCGNSNFCSQTITVMNTTPVVLTCATNKMVECGSSWSFDPPIVLAPCCGTNVTISVVSTVTNSSGPCAQTLTRTWLAVDCCTNRSVCSQTVTIVDTIPPTITCPSNIVVKTCGTNALVTWTILASDNCSSVTVTSTPPSGTYFLPNTTNMVVASAIDACSNRSTCTFTVAVVRPELGSLTITREGTNITMSWSDGILQGADSLLGPWTDVPFASPPSYTTSAATGKKFYRLRCNSP